MPTVIDQALRTASTDPYRPDVAMTSKNFQIAAVSVRPTDRAAMIRISAAEAVPARFTARVVLTQPKLDVEITVVVESGGFPRAESLTVQATNTTPLTGTTLRQVLLDPILRAAIAEASVPAVDRSDVAAGAFQVEGEAERALWIGAAPGSTERLRLAASIYNRRVAAGSRSPTQDMAEALNVSRPQASRYVKQARDAGLIPPAGRGARSSAGAPPAYSETPVESAGTEVWYDESGQPLFTRSVVRPTDTGAE